MEEFKIKFWGFTQKFKAYSCMFILNIAYVAILIVVPGFILCGCISSLSMAVATKWIMIAWAGASVLFILYRYFAECRKCVSKKVDAICKECKARKLNLCERQVKECKEANAKNAQSEIDRILPQIEKWKKMKKDKNAQNYIKYLEADLDRWKNIFEKNKN